MTVCHAKDNTLVATLEPSSGHAHRITALALDDDTKLLATGDQSGKIRIWKLNSRETPQEISAHTAAVTGLLFSNANTALISAGDDGLLRTWRLPVVPPRQIALRAAPRAVAVSPGKAYVAVLTKNNEFDVYHVETGEYRKTFSAADSTRLTSLAFSPDNRVMLAGDAAGHVACWRSGEGTQAADLRLHEGEVRQLAVHPVKPVFASAGSDGKVCFASLPRIEPLLEYDGNAAVRLAAVSRDGRQLATVAEDGSLCVASFGKKLTKSQLDKTGNILTSLAFSEDGKFVVAGARDGLVHVWSLAGTDEHRVTTLPAHQAAVSGVALNPAAGRLWSASADGTLRVWRWPLQAGKTLDEGDKRASVLAAARQDQFIVAGNSDGLLRVLPVDGNPNAAQSQRLTSGITALAMDPRGEIIAVGMATGSVLYRNRRLEPVGADIVAGAAGSIVGLAVHPQGLEVAVALKDGSVHILPTAVPSAEVQQTQSKDVSAIAVAGRQGIVAVGSATGAVYLHKPNESAAVQLRKHTARIVALTWSPEEQTLLSLSQDGTAGVGKAAGGETRLLQDKAGAIVAAAFVAEQRVATATRDGSLRLWDASSGQELAHWSRPKGTLTVIASSSDGAQLASADEQGMTRIWDMARGREVGAFRHPRGIVGLAWSKDGRYVAAADTAHAILLGDRKGGGEMKELARQPAAITALAFASDNNSLACGDATGLVQQWSLDGRPTFSINTGAAVGSLTWSEGKVVAAGLDGRVHRPRTAAQSRVLRGAADSVRDVVYLRDGVLATAGQDHTIRIWGADPAHPTQELNNTAAVTRLAATPAGETLAAASDDGSIRIWDLGKGVLRGVVAHPGAAHSMSIDSQGSALLVASKSAIRSYDLATLRQRQSFHEVQGGKEEVNAVAATGEGRMIVAAMSNGSLRRWESPLLASVQTDATGVRCFEATADGTRLLALGANGVSLWDAAGKPLGKLREEGLSLGSLAISPQGREAAALSSAESCVVLDAATGAALRRFPVPGVSANSRLAWSIDGKRIAVTVDRNVRIFSAANGQLAASFAFDEPIVFVLPPHEEDVLALTHAGRLFRLETGFPRQVAAHRGPVHDVAFSPAGDWVASAGDDKQIQLIDWTRGTIVRTISCGDQIVRSLVVTPDGSRICGGTDDRVAVWDATTGKRTAELPVPAPIGSLRLSGDGNLLVGVDSHQQLHGWDLRTLQAIATSAETGAGTKLIGFLGGDSLFVADSGESTAHVQHVLGQMAVRAASGGVSAIAQVAHSDEVAVAHGAAEVGFWQIFGAASTNSSLRKGQSPTWPSTRREYDLPA